MKKIFVEPKIKKIEINMNENIASSSVTGMLGYYFNTGIYCSIQNTTYTLREVYDGIITDADLVGCLVNTNAKIGGGTIVPAEEIRPYLRM